MPSNGEDLSGNDKMSKDSNNEDNGGSGGGVGDKRGKLPTPLQECGNHPLPPVPRSLETCRIPPSYYH
jgi:hypothetical protein